MLGGSMQILHALTVFCSLPQFATLISAEKINPSGDQESKEAETPLPANLILRRNAAIASQLAAGPALGVKKMSDDEGEKFFLDYWSFGDDYSSGNVTEGHISDDGFSPARFVAQSYPFAPSYSLGTDGDSQFLPWENSHSANNLLEKRDFKCPAGTWACTSIGRSDRCCGSGETCEIVADTGHGDVGCCPSWKTCSGMIGSCQSGYTACSEALGGGCCIPGYDCVEGGCAYITTITVTLHSTVMLSTVTYSTKPQDTTSTSASFSFPTTSSHSSKTTTNDGLAPPARPTNLSTVTSATRGDDVCPTGFYACSAVYHGGCCRTGRDCDTTSCPTISSTTVVSDGVTIVAPAATTTEHTSGNRCAHAQAAIMSETAQKPLPFVYQFAAGAVAGVSETGAPVPGVDHYNGMFDCFRKIVKNEGASRLYRGISAPILMEAPKRATKFAANDSWGAFYRNLFGVDKQTQSLATLTGATAGATEAFVVVPFELVKIRLQDKAQAHKYNGMFDVVKKIVAAEGPLAMYNGLESTMWRHVLWNAGYFGCIFQVRAQLPAVEPGNKNQQMRNDLIAGSIGGTTGTILNTPMDVVKSRIQNTTKVPGQVAKYNWAWPALGTVMKEEGFSALYKGFTPKVLRLGPGGGILLVVYTGVMDFFRKMRDGN
ncbi:hypothetical protein N7497_011803 [Penicillium chrysogenum]|nr:hypothetical protein N7497_011803 [Penicillium chrysogenum]